MLCIIDGNGFEISYLSVTIVQNRVRYYLTHTSFLEFVNRFRLPNRSYWRHHRAFLRYLRKLRSLYIWEIDPIWFRFSRGCEGLICVLEADYKWDRFPDHPFRNHYEDSFWVNQSMCHRSNLCLYCNPNVLILSSD